MIGSALLIAAAVQFVEIDATNHVAVYHLTDGMTQTVQMAKKTAPVISTPKPTKPKQERKARIPRKSKHGEGKRTRNNAHSQWYWDALDMMDEAKNRKPREVTIIHDATTGKDREIRHYERASKELGEVIDELKNLGDYLKQNTDKRLDLATNYVHDVGEAYMKAINEITSEAIKEVK